MATATIVSTITIGSISTRTTISRTASSNLNIEETLPAGNAGTLSTRTNNTDGILTIAEGHGITDANTVNVFWSGGMRYGATVSAYNSTTITITGGTGDNLPTQDSAIVVAAQVTINAAWIGNDMEMLTVSADYRCHLDIRSSGASLKAVEIADGDEGWNWADDTADTNPLTDGTVAAIKASAGETSATALKVGVLYDGTP